MNVPLPQWLVARLNQLRPWLAALRLLLLFPLLCFLLGEMALLLRATHESSARLVEPLPIPDPALPFLGITVALENRPAAARQATLHRLRDSGFGWVRQRLDWGQFEPQPGIYDWHNSDAMVADIIAAGLTPVLLLDGSPAWARSDADRGITDNPLAPPADPALFAHFAAAVAQRYGPAVRFYQLWDEPNIAPHWGNRHIEPVQYAQLVKITAPAIRAADPDAVIVLAALAPTADRGHLALDEVYFLQRLYAAGAAPFFDVAAAQPFGFGAAPDDERALPSVLNFQRVKLLRRAMVAAGDGSTPIWAVRYGWNTRGDSPWRTVTPADQARFVTAALTIARQEWPWLMAMGWAIDQPTQPPTNPSWGFALTPTLAQAFHVWQPPGTLPLTQNAIPSTFIWRWGGLIIGLLLVGWRFGATCCVLPWAIWGPAYQAQPLWRKGLVWLLLAVAYYFATWPPLILLCWLAAMLLILPAPITGLVLTALLLPFYFQHKELAVAGFAVMIPPAHAVLGCLSLALLVRLLGRCKKINPVGASPCGRPQGDAPTGLGILFFGTALLKLPTLTWRTRWVRIESLHSLDGLALLWLGITLASTLQSWRWPGAGQGLLNLALLPCLAYVATRVVATTPNQRLLLCTALFLGGLLAAGGGLIRWQQGQGTAADGVLRLVGPYFSPNHAALYLERIVWIGVGLALPCHGQGRRWFAASWWVAIGVIVSALWLTASRGAWLLGMPAGGIVFLWASGLLRNRPFVVRSAEERRRWIIGAVFVTIVVIGVIGLLAGQPLWERFSNSATVAERLRIWQATGQLWIDQWLWGVGPGGFFWHYPRYWLGGADSDPNLLHPHNLWLEVLAGWGIVGLGWFLLLGWHIGRQLLWAREQALTQPQLPWQTIGLLAAFAAGIAHGQVDTFGALPDLALWQWLAVGLLAATPKPVHNQKVAQ